MDDTSLFKYYSYGGEFPMGSIIDNISSIVLYTNSF